MISLLLHEMLSGRQLFQKIGMGYGKWRFDWAIRLIKD